MTASQAIDVQYITHEGFLMQMCCMYVTVLGESRVF